VSAEARGLGDLNFGENHSAIGSSHNSVLVVDDDPIVRDVLGRYLRKDGFVVGSAADGEAALLAVDRESPDLVVLDLMMPKVDGIEVFRRLRTRDRTPAVIMLTARGDPTDRAVGLESGADDYVAKPFSPREIVARCRAVLRRTREAEPPLEEDSGAMAFERLTIEPVAREVRIGGEVVALTPKEFDLLHFLAARPRVAFTRFQLLDEVWDVAYDGDPSTVTVHVRRLREKVEEDPSEPRHLLTVWGAGYRFDP
jgi:two-component system response regulator ResD